MLFFSHPFVLQIDNGHGTDVLGQPYYMDLIEEYFPNKVVKW